jgi:lipopolysaccharide transport system ATP-binding protein
MSESVIRAEGLSKRYRVGERERYLALRDILARAFAASFRRDGGPRTVEYLWALRGVSFDVRQGEVIGLIGRNGAGKSSLLKVLSRITRPTEGFAEVRGRIGSLLEVGTGFHPELTGRENVYLSGAVLGMRRSEIDRKFDEIIAFSGVEPFLDTPLKHFSTGMQMRLAFAVAAHLEPEILLVDEVLAVGDAEFQKKCLGKMQDVSKSGRTIVFVSHNMGAISRLCKRAFWLDEGRVRLMGETSEVIGRYQSCYLAGCPEWVRAASAGDEDREFTFRRVRAVNGGGVAVLQGNDSLTVEIDYVVRRALTACQISARICNSEGLAIFTTSDADDSGFSALPIAPGSYRTGFTIPAGFLSPGVYYVLLGAHLPGHHIYDMVEQTVVFEVSQVGSLSSLDGRYGIVAPMIKWETNALAQ